MNTVPPKFSTIISFRLFPSLTILQSLLIEQRLSHNLVLFLRQVVSSSISLMYGGSASTAKDFMVSNIGLYPVHRHVLLPKEFSNSALVNLFGRRLQNNICSSVKVIYRNKKKKTKIRVNHIGFTEHERFH